MFTPRTLATACAWLVAAMTPAAQAHAASVAASPRAEVIHWWTSGGESAAVKQVAQAYRNAGGVWIDTAIAGGDKHSLALLADGRIGCYGSNFFRQCGRLEITDLRVPAEVGPGFSVQP